MRISFSGSWLTILLSVLLVAHLATPGAAEEKDIKVSARIVPAATADKAQLKLTAQLADDWHIYSTTQPDGGPLKTVITLKSSPHYQPGARFVADHQPEVKFSEDFPGVPIEEFHGQVTWTSDLQLSPGVKLEELAVAGTLKGQLCTDLGACKPISIEFAAVGEPGGAANGATSESKPAPIAASQGDAIFTSVTGNLTIEGEIRPASIAPGGKAELRITSKPAKGYHTYALAARDPNQGSKPTLIVVTESGGLKLGAPQTTSPVIADKDEKGEPSTPHHEGEVTWTLPIQIPADATPGDFAIAGMIGAQVCSDKGCDPMEGARFSGTLTVGSAKQGATPLLFVKAKYKEVDKAAATQGTSAAAPMPATAGDDELTSSGDLINAESSLAFVLVIAIVGGFILNFMPCVLPVVGLKLLSFAKQAGQSRGQAFLLNLAYAGGQLAIFLLLATAAVTLNLAWGQHFSSVAFVVTMTAVMFAMSLSFLGVWEMPVPGFGAEDQVNELAEQEGLLGAFFQGVLTTILATPCSGPMLGAVFNFCLAQPPYVTYLVFSFLALGMSLPYLVIGLEPSLIRFLPKPGEWMNTFKSLVGFSMLAGVGMLVSFVHQDYMIATLELLVAVGLACWLIGKIPAGSSIQESWPTWAWGTGVVAAGAVLSFWLAGPSAYKIKWQEYSPPLAEKLQKEGHTVMVDFTANWCLSCKYNKRWVIETPEVAAIVKEYGITPILADWTDGSEEIGKHLAKLDSNSIPVLAIYPAGKPGKVIVLRDVISQTQLLEKLREAGPSQPRIASPQRENSVVMTGGGE